MTVNEDDDESTERSVDVDAVDMLDTFLEEDGGGPIACTFALKFGIVLVRAGEGAAMAVLGRGG